MNAECSRGQSRYKTSKQYAKYYNSINNTYFKDLNEKTRKNTEINYNELNFYKNDTNNGRAVCLEGFRDELDYSINGDLIKRINMQRRKDALNNNAYARLAKKEAEEYHEKFKRLEIENARLEAQLATERRSTDNCDSQTQCCICMTERKDHVFVQCGHMAACGDCSAHCSNICPICRTYSHIVAKVFY